MSDTTCNLDQFKAGQPIRCTITKEPRAEDKSQTIARLMRHDPAMAKSLRKAQRGREKRMIVYTRGGRDWYQRERCGKILRVKEGESWTMPFTFQIAPDLAAVATFLKIESA